MNKTAVKNFAVWARNKLIEEITYKAGLLGITEKGIAEELPASTDTLKLYDIGTKEPVKIEGSDIAKRKSLVSAIKSKAELTDHKSAFENVVNEVAYTWFNRLIAVRFMEVNDYLPSGVRVLSSEKAGKNEPDMVTDPFDTDIVFSEADRTAMSALKDDELFRFLFIKQCNKLNEVLPELFEKTDSYSEILLTLSFTDTDSVVYHLVHDIPEEDFNVEKQGQIQIIGWLYQYYNTEPKNDVFKALKSNIKISSDNIPAATQLFTPDWIVRYMVENSLGRLWVDGHSDFDRSEWKYYLDEAEQDDEVKKQLAAMREEYKNIEPEKIKFCDPCMGSGHILVYAFDVLIQIYLSRGYSEREAAAKIIRNNLYGLDIDKRAYQLAYFALMMKARQYDRRFLTRGIAPNLSHFQGLENVKKANTNGALNEFVKQFNNCETYGSLMEISEVKGLDDALDNFSEMIALSSAQVEQMMRIYTVLSQKYDAVCTNPPYMGGSGMNNVLGDFVKKKYPDSKSDLFAVFIERCGRLAKSGGYYAMITQHAWMFLSSYEKLREKLLLNTTVNMAHLGARAFEEIGGEVVQTTSFVMSKKRIADYRGTYCRLIEPTTQDGKEEMFLAQQNRFIAQQENFSKIPGAPVAYWASQTVFENFEKGKTLGAFAYPKQGLASADNNRFLKLWHEVNYCKISFNKTDNDTPTLNKWYPHNKGGEFRKWYGNRFYVIDWEHNGMALKNFNGSVIRNPDFYFKELISYSDLTSGNFSIRYYGIGFTFDSTGPSIFNSGNYVSTIYLLGIMNSNVINTSFLKILCPTMHYTQSAVAKVPIILCDDSKTVFDVESLVQGNIHLSKKDWDSFETSWDFMRHPLLEYMVEDERETVVVKANEHGEYADTGTEIYISIENAFLNWERICDERFQKLKSNEEELNRIFIDIYGLQAELTPEVEDKDVTVRKAELERDIKSFISYAVGCMFGRYSLDKEGLVFAGGDFDKIFWKYKGQAPLDENGLVPEYGGYAGISMASYHYPRFRDKSMSEWMNATVLSFEPACENCIPITDEEYFADDIVKRFVDFVEAVYGKNTLEENLEFIANALNTKGDSPRRKIRNYFLGDFIKDHIKTYQKRPIYWLFDSGKQNGFKALVYTHRWDSNTIGNVRVEYLHKLQRIYESEIDRMRETIDATDNNREKALAEKRLDKLTKQLKETRDYDAKLSHLALESIDIDLDDGVKVNYEKVQTSRDGKRLEILTPLK